MKRLLDLSAALVAAVVLAPVLVMAAVLIRLTMGSPVLFRQRRPGLYGKPFVLCKFRTMRFAYDHHGQPLPDPQRLTRLGRLLRKTSLDELPQLWNVLRGEMSLVGPRPLLMQYLDRYTPEQARRHDVRPGITGWAQVHGRQTLCFSKRLELDVWYVDHWSLWLDVKILGKTVLNVLRAEGVKLDQKAEEVDDLGLYTHPE
jgi:lipopolysaccharide/colanic/teichoic acid biosynthesis glycosyltransferase